MREPAGPAASLRAAYPSAREHDRAVRWLTWIAWQLDGRRDLAWWEIPGWVGEPGLRYVRTATGAVLLGLAFALGFGGYAPPNGLAAGLPAALISVYLGNRLPPGRLRRGPAPQAMIPARPRTRQAAVLLALAVATGLFLRPVLIRRWGRPVAGPPAASYLACRRSTVIDAAACLLTGLPLALAGLAAGEVGLAALAAVAAGLAVLTALADGPLPALKQAELAVALRRRRPVSFRRLLETAADRQVLVPAGAYYQFRDPAVQRYLHGLQQTAAGERRQRKDRRRREIAGAADGKHGTRPWLIGLLWTALFALLAGTSLAFAVWPGRLKRVTGWFTRLRVVPSVTVTSRVTSGVHIGLLVVVLVGLAAPAAVEPALRARLADRYTETLTDDLRAHGELAAYRQAQRAFRTIGLPLLAPLADLVLQIDRTSRPRDGQHGATGVELDLARRMGQLQAVALGLDPPDIAAAEAAATRQAGLDEPAASPDAENERLARLDSARKEDDATERLVDQAAELAAAAVARALPLPGLGDTEIAQVVKEYLSSLVEGSPLKDVFAAWAGRIAGRDEPPGAAEAVVPDQERLKDAARAAAGRELARTPVTDPDAVRRLAAETGVAAAVDLENQVRYLQEGNGPCEGCARPEPPAERRGPDDRPFEPPEFIR